VSSDLALSAGLLVVELVLFAIFFIRSKHPPTPGQVRVFPYAAALIILVVVIFVTSAHVISLITGTPLQPRRMKGMR